jgi:hypothetical protein
LLLDGVVGDGVDGATAAVGAVDVGGTSSVEYMLLKAAIRASRTLNALHIAIARRTFATIEVTSTVRGPNDASTIGANNSRSVSFDSRHDVDVGDGGAGDRVLLQLSSAYLLNNQSHLYVNYV